MNLRYYIAYKPYNMLCQFTDSEGRPTLADLGQLPKDVYAVGRLDLDSEGLLLLTNDKYLNHAMLNPKFRHQRTYWAQVEGIPTPAALKALERGVTITVDGKPYQTLPAKARLFSSPPDLPERNPPIRYRKHVPDAWIELSLIEGKNRQVRKMTAQVGFPTLRLVRARMEGLSVGNLQPGELREISKEEAYTRLLGR